MMIYHSIRLIANKAKHAERNIVLGLFYCSCDYYLHFVAAFILNNWSPCGQRETSGTLMFYSDNLSFIFENLLSLSKYI